MLNITGKFIKVIKVFKYLINDLTTCSKFDIYTSKKFENILIHSMTFK